MIRFVLSSTSDIELCVVVVFYLNDQVRISSRYFKDLNSKNALNALWCNRYAKINEAWSGSRRVLLGALTRPCSLAFPTRKYIVECHRCGTIDIINTEVTSKYHRCLRRSMLNVISTLRRYSPLYATGSSLIIHLPCTHTKR